ncbi:MAG: hypothetical protein LQ346_009005, partial [Caloplaca aetnensis]
MTSNPAITVSNVPDEPPPSYDAATTTSQPPSAHASADQSSRRHRNGIPPEYRRSMEDEGRPLPQGWVRQYDPDNQHQFFVDTTRDPPRSIWHHPYDDDEYMDSLDPRERQRIQGSLRVPSRDDIAAESSDEDRDDRPPSRTGATHAPAPPSSSQQAPSSGASKLGRRLKDKLTNTTHEQREEQRRQRAIAEQEAYEQHRKLRAAMVEAMRSGQPQLVGKDRSGKDVYIEPPPTPGHMGRH